MIDRYILPLQHRVLAPAAGQLARWGVGADRLTLLGFGVGLAVAPLLAMGQNTAALLVILGQPAS